MGLYLQIDFLQVFIIIIPEFYIWISSIYRDNEVKSLKNAIICNNKYIFH